MAKKNWMRELETHYARMRDAYPEEKLLILFDIDGTILDMRHMILHVLQAYDFKNNTQYFHHLKTEDIKVHENHVDRLLEELHVPIQDQEKIMSWYIEKRWSHTSILESHHPFRGVMDVIRWFQFQPDTYVGLNTGRPESIREDTLRSLNKIAKEYRVEFTNELLYMNPLEWEEKVANSKADGVELFRKKGYRIFAVVDNEPDNLKSISKIDPNNEILLLHADTIFESKRSKSPRHKMIGGKKYDLTELITEKSLPDRVQLVWHGINDEVNLRQFLASDIFWGELDVRREPLSDKLLLRHDSFEESPLQADEDFHLVKDYLDRINNQGRGAKLDLKEGGITIDRLLEEVKTIKIEATHLWFNGNVERLQEEGFRKISQRLPSAVLQCPVDFLAPLVLGAPEKAKEILDMFRDWGINRYSLNWMTPNKREIFDQMDHWGFEVNIYNVPDLEAFLQAALLLPRSITSDFNFPKWFYYGRGSGEKLARFKYEMGATTGKQ
jgi:hypothetical protein